MPYKNAQFAIVVSDFNRDITSKLLEGAIQHLAEKEIATSQIKIVHVPGAVEVPLIAKRLAEQKKYDAIICLGCVIRGDTDHYQYVCAQVSEGCQQVMLQYNLPVIFGVLTTQNEAQALARVGGSEGHKGIEAAMAAIDMINVLHELN
ncbi:MAG: 6,7-dimethyl-8-ribityllumazine synthase [Gammaproteobacteria bacterium]|nr:6,7-dimethyl-8-ribityllumazine synthase [Gammaproteobacteria bacterium]